MPGPGALVVRRGMVTAIGLGAVQTSSSVLAGVAGFRESAVQDAAFQPITMALLPEDALPELAPAVGEIAGLTSRQRRLLRLATPALEEILDGLAGERIGPSTPLFLATPEKHPDLAEPAGDEFLDHLVKQLEPLGLAFDRKQSRRVGTGRAGGLAAVGEALRYLESRGGKYAIAGGVDTYLDLMLLATLGRDGRILGPTVRDGFIPGEGAGFLLLASPDVRLPESLTATATICGVGEAQESGHRYSEDPYRGDGLSAALADVLTRPKLLRKPVEAVFAGLNGESFGGKEWGVASVRSSKEIEPTAPIIHPADCFGDIGAALGPVMIGLAAEGIARSTNGAPALVWCSSDGAARSAALLDTVKTR